MKLKFLTQDSFEIDSENLIETCFLFNFFKRNKKICSVFLSYDAIGRKKNPPEPIYLLETSTDEEIEFTETILSDWKKLTLIF